MQSDAKSAENTEKKKEASEKTPVQTPDETADGASATASENPQLTRYLAQEYGGDWAQTVTPEQLQKAKYRLGLAVTDDPALNTPLYNNLTPDAVQELKREYGRRWWNKATEEDVLIVQQASLAGRDSAADGITQGNDADLEESVKKGSEPLTGNIINRDTSVTGSRKPYITSRPNYGKSSPAGLDKCYWLMCEFGGERGQGTAIPESSVLPIHCFRIPIDDSHAHYH